MVSKCMAIVLAIAGWVLSAPSFAWSENGHETVGAIADNLIAGHKAAAQVQAILGTVNGKPLTLSMASVWADCARSIDPDKNFAYAPDPKYRIAACDPFSQGAEHTAMATYVQTNTSCVYEGTNKKCHEAYHFADVDIANDGYASGHVGAQEYDVVHATQAAILALQHKPYSKIFNFPTDRDALMLLTHFIGDLHQPLHVGAIYLDANGKPFHPKDGTPADNDAAIKQYGTTGGNVIKVKSGNLHGEWDETSFGFSNAASMAPLVKDAKAVKPDGDRKDMLNWPASWAGDTIRQAQVAYQNISFSARQGSDWSATISDADYGKKKDAMQRQQVVKGGARLAELLEAIWPD